MTNVRRAGSLLAFTTLAFLAFGPTFAGRDGSGVYTRPSNSFSTPTLGTPISPTDADALFDDMEAAISGSAVKTPSFVTMGTDAALPNERVLTAGTGLSLTDGGAGSTATFALSDAELLCLAGLTSAADRLPYFTGSGTCSLATFTAFGRSLVDDADATTARTTLGLGTSATVNTGTSGATIPLLNAANTWLTTQTFTAAPVFTDQSGTRTALGLGTSATVNTGTSGATVPLLNGNNTYSGTAAFSGAHDIQAALSISGDTSPTQITADQNDYAPTNFATNTVLRINSDAARNITGLAGGSDGLEKLFCNIGSFTITFKDGSASSTAANRFDLGADLGLTAKACQRFYYDSTSSRWRAQSLASSGGGSGTVTSVTCGGATITTSGTCPEPFSIQNCSLAASVASNLLTVAIKDAAGSDPTASSPCRIPFRSATATTGSTSYVSVAAATSISTNATGATLGSASNTAFRFWVVAMNNSGTVVPALFNASTTSQCFPINESVAQSSTAISGSATAAGTYYTPNGTTVTSKAIRILGYVEYNSTGLVTAGTYASAPNFIQNYGAGIKLPCEVVQSVQGTQTNNPTTRTGSTAFVASTLTASITPTSAANRVNVSVAGALECVTSTNSASAKLAVMRSGTAVSPNTFVYCATSTILIAAATLMYMDSPNTASSTIYAGGLAISNAAETAIFPAAGPDNSSGGVIQLMEVQG
jgi:hypothetical protein